MSRKIKISAAVTAFFLFLRSHSSDAHLSVIPENAMTVLKIDIKSLLLKADPTKLKDLPVFKSKQGKDLFGSILGGSTETGIDPLENIYGFVSEKDAKTIMGFVIKLDDAKKFSEFISKQATGNSVTEMDGYSVIENGSDNVIAWSDDAGLFLSGNGGQFSDLAGELLKQDQSKSIAEQEDYKTFSQKDFDMGLFINNKQMSVMNAMVGLQFNPLGISDGYGEMLINFEEDQIKATYNNFQKTASIPLLSKNPVADSHYDAIAAKNPILYLGLALDMNMLFTSLKTDKQISDGIRNMEMFTGFGEAKLKQLFTGNISFAVSDYQDITSYDPRISAEMRSRLSKFGLSKDDLELELEDAKLYSPLAYISADITDEKVARELLTVVGLEKKDSIYVMPGMQMVVYGAVNNGHLLITNDYFAALELTRSGKLSGKVSDIFNKKTPLAGWFDFEQSHWPSTLTSADATDYLDTETITIIRMLEPYQNMYLKNTDTGAELTIELNKGDGNSLYQLIAWYANSLN
jgi:hypothetical protein